MVYHLIISSSLQLQQVKTSSSQQHYIYIDLYGNTAAGLCPLEICNSRALASFPHLVEGPRTQRFLCAINKAQGEEELSSYIRIFIKIWKYKKMIIAVVLNFWSLPKSGTTFSGSQAKALPSAIVAVLLILLWFLMLFYVCLFYKACFFALSKLCSINKHALPNITDDKLFFSSYSTKSTARISIFIWVVACHVRLRMGLKDTLRPLRTTLLQQIALHQLNNVLFCSSLHRCLLKTGTIDL